MKKNKRVLKEKMEIILASQSSRREELLNYLQIPFKIIPSSIEEVIDPIKSPVELAISLSLQKAYDIHDLLKQENAIVIGADTIVLYDNMILGKPVDKVAAKSCLSKLSSQTHDVITGVTIVKNKKSVSFSQTTQVTFSNITKDLMNAYLMTDDCLDKAGSYGIQGMGQSFIKEIHGSYSNVVGFPLNEFYYHFLKFLNLDESNWRSYF